MYQLHVHVHTVYTASVMSVNVDHIYTVTSIEHRIDEGSEACYRPRCFVIGNERERMIGYLVSGCTVLDCRW